MPLTYHQQLVFILSRYWIFLFFDTYPLTFASTDFETTPILSWTALSHSEYYYFLGRYWQIYWNLLCNFLWLIPGRYSQPWIINKQISFVFDESHWVYFKSTTRECAIAVSFKISKQCFIHRVIISFGGNSYHKTFNNLWNSILAIYKTLETLTVYQTDKISI